VVVRERELRGPGDAHKAGRPALERTVGTAVRVRGRDEEKDRGFDVGLVVIRERRAGELILQPVGDAATVEGILQAAVALVIHDRHDGPREAGAQRSPDEREARNPGWVRISLRSMRGTNANVFLSLTPVNRDRADTR